MSSLTDDHRAELDEPGFVIIPGLHRRPDRKPARTLAFSTGESSLLHHADTRPARETVPGLGFEQVPGLYTRSKRRAPGNKRLRSYDEHRH
jgi:hypothetical protein